MVIHLYGNSGYLTKVFRLYMGVLYRLSFFFLKMKKAIRGTKIFLSDANSKFIHTE